MYPQYPLSGPAENWGYPEVLRWGVAWLMPFVSDAEWKVLCLLFHHLYGFQMKALRCFPELLAQQTGLTPKTAQTAVAGLAAKGIIGLADAPAGELSLFLRQDFSLDRFREGVSRARGASRASAFQLSDPSDQIKPKETIVLVGPGVEEGGSGGKEKGTSPAARTEDGWKNSPWVPFYRLVSEAFGGTLACRRGDGSPQAWLGQLATVTGNHCGKDPDKACALWTTFVDEATESGAWDYITSRNVVERMGKWAAQRRDRPKGAPKKMSRDWWGEQ